MGAHTTVATYAVVPQHQIISIHSDEETFNLLD